MASAVDTSRYVIPSYDSLSSQLSNGIQLLSNISSRNSARSASEADTLRQWQADQFSKQMEYNSSEATKNRDWQEMMSNTSHQREVNDLIAAGLNPVLSASGGNGASVGSGASASVSMPSGAKGDVDTSANAAIVNLLTSFLSAQTSMTESAMSAVQSHALADKSNAVSQLIAEITSAATRDSASIHASATRDSASISRSASMYASNKAFQSDQLDRQNARYLQDAQQMFTENHPTSAYGFVSSGLNKALDLIHNLTSPKLAQATVNTSALREALDEIHSGKHYKNK